MSQWTHVAAVFRLDSFGAIPDSVITEIFGKEVGFEDLRFEMLEDNVKILPMGSEGTLHISIWHNPDPSHIASTTVSVFGDLRDYGGTEDVNKLKAWFDDCCSHFVVRQAIMQIDDGYAKGMEVYEYSEDEVGKLNILNSERCRAKAKVKSDGALQLP